MSDTKVCNTCGAEKPLDEYHIRKENGKHRNECKECTRSNNRRRAKENPQWDRDRYQRDKVKRKAAVSAYRRKNPDKATEWSRTSRRRNPAHYNAKSSEYRALKLERTVSWANPDKIKAKYQEAKDLEATLGIPFHVDHIVPLRGEKVCGLHVETNLQVIPATLNIRKSNKFKV